MESIIINIIKDLLFLVIQQFENNLKLMKYYFEVLWGIVIKCLNLTGLIIGLILIGSISTFRLMVRVDQMESRRRMVDFLLRIDDPNILRLFVANQGFALIRIWFVLPSFERRALQLQSQIVFFVYLIYFLTIFSRNEKLSIYF